MVPLAFSSEMSPFQGRGECPRMIVYSMLLTVTVLLLGQFQDRSVDLKQPPSATELGELHFPVRLIRMGPSITLSWLRSHSLPDGNILHFLSDTGIHVSIAFPFCSSAKDTDRYRDN